MRKPRRIIERAATAADLGIKAHAHMLRHAAATSSQTMATTREQPLLLLTLGAPPPHRRPTISRYEHV